MITKKMIEAGIRQGIVKLIVGPLFNVGTVCQIGDNWFYFDEAADHLGPEEYQKKVSVEDIANKIYDILKDDLGGTDEYEREYYESYLKENIHILYVVVEHYKDSCIEVLFKSRSEDEAKSFMKKRWVEACNDAGIQLCNDCWEDSMTYDDSDEEAYLFENYGCYYGDCNYHIQVLEIEL